MKKNIAIVGGGPAALCCAFHLKDHCDVVIYERGKSLEDRLADTNSDVTSGIGGAGTFSDGKLTLSPFVGTSQWMLDTYGPVFIARQLQEIDQFYLAHGAPEGHLKVAEYSEDFKRQVRTAGFNIIDKAAVRHIGTESGAVVIGNILSAMKDKVRVLCEVEVVPNLIFRGDQVEIQATDKNGNDVGGIFDYVVFAIGRSGAAWMKEVYENTELPFSPGIVDIGVRCETHSDVFSEFVASPYGSFDPKLSRLSSFGERTRLFCSCLSPKSFVCKESYSHILDENGNPLILVNGHSFSSNDNDPEHYSGNSNFSILVSLRLTKPFSDPIGYIRSIGHLSNVLADHSVLAQSYRDFKKQRRSTDLRIKETGIIPSIKDPVVFGDISLCLPYRTMKAIEEFVDSMAILFPGVDNCICHTLEAKFYNNCAKFAGKELHYEGFPAIYAVGDGSGATRSLSTSTLHGKLTAEKILEKLGK